MLRRIGGTVTAAIAIGGAAGAVVDVSGRSQGPSVPLSSPSPQKSPSAPHSPRISGTGVPRASGTAPSPSASHRYTHRPSSAPSGTP